MRWMELKIANDNIHMKEVVMNVSNLFLKSAFK